MKHKKPFKVGATYQLVSYGDFQYTPYITRRYGELDITFTVASVDSTGHARDDRGYLIACNHERHLFNRIDNK